jgi:NAD(P)-dependent dehydrogenase (short-subunit alcohol dehydrogenase family)
MTSRRVAVIVPANSYVGPDLGVALASRGYDLVLGDPSDEVMARCEAHGATVVAVPAADPHDEHIGRRVVATALDRFGAVHSAFFSSGRIAGGRFASTDIAALRDAFAGNVEAPYHFVQAVLPTMLEQGDGQILVATSATAGKPTPKASLYAATRAAATMMLQSAALEFADSGVQLNVVGTNFMNFPGFLKGNRAETPEGRAKVESLVPMRRLGELAEFAQFCAVFLDGASRFQTGQFFTYAGGW